MTPRHVHVVGAGLAGLAAALDLAEAGIAVTVHEAGPAAGGRCRSYLDRELGVRLDNGNHLLLSGNTATWRFLDRVGARDTMGGPRRPLFPFVDVATGERWAVRPNPGRLPWWVLRRDRRVPGTRARDYAALLRLRRAGADTTVDQALPSGTLRTRLLDPFAIAALNTRTEEGSARLLGAVVEESLALGGAACIPSFPREGLSESFVEPALARLRALGAELRFGSRVARLGFGDELVVALDDATIGTDEAVVLAAPAHVAAALVPGLTVPDRFEAIVNVHYRVEVDGGEAGFVGLVSGLAEWAFAKPGVASVTVSAANRLADLPNEAIAQQCWGEVATAFGLSEPQPSFRVLREKRATFAATPDQDRRRPAARTPVHNLVLAGDWTRTGLPATIEGAIRSGNTAATLLLT
jgi:squalene-associated FAD-dependent desaturase